MARTGKTTIRDIRRDELTRAAMKCIAEKGYDGVTLDDVTREAGLSKGIAAYYFRSREELLVSVIRRMRDNVRELTRRIWDLPGDQDREPDERTYRRLREYYANPEIDLAAVIRNGVELLFSWLENNPHVLNVILEFWCHLPRNRVIAELNQSMKTHLQRVSAIILREGMKRGVFKRRDPGLAAHALLSAITGIALSQVLYDREFDTRKLEKAVIEIVFHYLQG